jgi:hypothetical protein
MAGLRVVLQGSSVTGRRSAGPDRRHCAVHGSKRRMDRDVVRPADPSGQMKRSSTFLCRVPGSDAHAPLNAWCPECPLRRTTAPRDCPLAPLDSRTATATDAVMAGPQRPLHQRRRPSTCIVHQASRRPNSLEMRASGDAGVRPDGNTSGRQAHGTIRTHARMPLAIMLPRERKKPRHDDIPGFLSA